MTLLEIDQKTGRRTVTYRLSEHLRAKGARQVYELRGGRKIAEVRREESRYRKYGLNGEDVAVFLINQRGLCPGCGVAFSREVDFVIDHCHDSGKVRGLLCSKCNIVLAHYMTPGRLRKLAKYLEDAK